MGAVVPRQNHLAAIHMAQKSLGLSKEDATALKLAVTGVASAGDMSATQRSHYLAHLSGLQAQAAGTPKPVYTGARRALYRSLDDANDARWSKARALWAALARVGAVRHDTDAALTAYALRQTHVQAWRFLNGHQINTVIESLKRWCVRAKAEIEPNGY